MNTIEVKSKPVRLWPAALIAGVAFLGAALELAWPDGPYAEGRPIRMQIEALGLPLIITSIATSAVRVWVSLANFVPVVGVGTAAGALLLAALNWRRMGQPHTFVVVLLLAFVVATMPRAKLFSEGIYLGYLVVALMHVGVGVVLFVLQRNDIAQFRLTHARSVKSASLVIGAFIALVGVIAQSVLSYVGIALALQANLLFGGRVQ